MAGVLATRDAVAADGPLPMGWHWAYLLDRPSLATSGPDGHVAGGGMDGNRRITIVTHRYTYARAGSAPKGAAADRPVASAAGALGFAVDPRTLFAFSALTGNVHRLPATFRRRGMSAAFTATPDDAGIAAWINDDSGCITATARISAVIDAEPYAMRSCRAMMCSASSSPALLMCSASATRVRS